MASIAELAEKAFEVPRAEAKTEREHDAYTLVDLVRDGGRRVVGAYLQCLLDQWDVERVSDALELLAAKAPLLGFDLDDLKASLTIPSSGGCCGSSGGCCGGGCCAGDDLGEELDDADNEVGGLQCGSGGCCGASSVRAGGCCGGGCGVQPTNGAFVEVLGTADSTLNPPRTHH